MRTTINLTLLIFFLAIGFIGINRAFAQGSVPPEVASIVKMKLADGQDKLTSLGYEVCSSSMFGKKQDWFNESTKNCVTVKFDKKEVITDVTQNSGIADCQKGLEASRKVWEKYHDGEAPVHTAKIDEERKKLTDQGYKVSYWVNEVSPGRNSEYWINETAKKTMYIVWEIQGNVWAMTESTDFKMGKNPAPKK